MVRAAALSGQRTAATVVITAASASQISVGALSDSAPLADDQAPDPTGVTQNHEVERLLANWVETLSQREKEVLEGRFGLHDREPETLEVLSDRLGLTRERVRQIQNEALLKLRRHMVRNGIDREALF